MKKQFFKNLFGLLAIFAVTFGLVSCENGDNGDSSPSQIAVSSVTIQGDKISNGTLQLKKGENISLSAIISPENASEKSVTWISTQPDVATIDSNGKLSAISLGSATITVSAGGKTANITVTVKSSIAGTYLFGANTVTFSDDGKNALITDQTICTVEAISFDGIETITIKNGETVIYTATSTNGIIENIKDGDGTPIPEPTGEFNFRKVPNYTNIKSFTIPKGYTSTGDSSFNGANALESITMPDTITSIGGKAFAECASLKFINFSKNLTSIGSESFRKCPAIESITLPNSVEKVGNYAWECSSLHSIKLSKKLTSIGEYAFYQTPLESIEIPINVTEIGRYAFAYCDKLTKITVADGNTTYQAENNILYEKGKTTIVCYPASKTEKTFSIPTEVTSIQRTAFAGCTSLKTMSIGNNVEYIGNNAFSDCTSLESVTIGSKVTYIGNKAFVETALSSAKFENPTGWWYGESEKSLAGEIIDADYLDGTSAKTGNSTTSLSNTTTAANFLTLDCNDSRHWFRNEQDIENAVISSFALSPLFQEISIGGNANIVPKIKPSSISSKFNVSWASNDESIATVNNGVVEGISAGNAIITATVVDGENTFVATSLVKVGTTNPETYKYNAEWNFEEYLHWESVFGPYDTTEKTSAHVTLSDRYLEPSSGSGATLSLSTKKAKLRGNSSGIALQSDKASLSTISDLESSYSIFILRIFGNGTTVSIKACGAGATEMESRYTTICNSEGNILKQADGTNAIIQIESVSKDNLPEIKVENLSAGIYYIYTNGSRVYSITAKNE